MGKIDVKSRVQVDQLFTKISRNANASIQGVNVSGFDGQSFLIDVGTHTADDFDVTLQHRDGDGDWEAIPHNQLDTTEDLTDSKVTVGEDQEDSQIYIGYTGIKEQIGAVLTRNDSAVIVFGVSVIKGSPKQFPVNV